MIGFKFISTKLLNKLSQSLLNNLSGVRNLHGPRTSIDAERCPVYDIRRRSGDDSLEPQRPSLEPQRPSLKPQRPVLKPQRPSLSLARRLQFPLLPCHCI